MQLGIAAAANSGILAAGATARSRHTAHAPSSSTPPHPAAQILSNLALGGPVACQAIADTNGALPALAAAARAGRGAAIVALERIAGGGAGLARRVAEAPGALGALAAALMDWEGAGAAAAAARAFESMLGCGDEAVVRAVARAAGVLPALAVAAQRSVTEVSARSALTLAAGVGGGEVAAMVELEMRNAARRLRTASLGSSCYASARTTAEE